MEFMKTVSLEIDIGWNGQGFLERINGNCNTSVESDSKLQSPMTHLFENVMFLHRLAQDRKSIDNAERNIPLTYKVGNSISSTQKLFTDSYFEVQPSQNLGIHRFGPFWDLE